MNNRLITVRVVLQLTSRQIKVVDGLFRAEIRVVQLLAADGLPEPTSFGASQFLLKHRSALQAHLNDHRDATVDRLKALVLQLATEPVSELRLRIHGTPSISKQGLALPVKGIGAVKLKDSLANLNQKTLGVAILSEFDLFYDGTCAAVELRMWGTSPADKTQPVKSPEAKPKVDAKRTTIAQITKSAENVKSPPGKATRKERKVADRANTAWKTKPALRSPGVTVTRRTGALPESPSTVKAKMLPAQNFRGSTGGVRTVSMDCSCNGENATCFRCDGRGYYEKPTSSSPAPAPARKASPVVSKSIARYEKDGRGGSYAVREDGRFLSNPDHDNYDDESGS